MGFFEVNCPSVFSVIEFLTLSNTCKNINNHRIFAVLVKFSLVDANMPVFEARGERMVERPAYLQGDST